MNDEILRSLNRIESLLQLIALQTKQPKSDQSVTGEASAITVFLGVEYRVHCSNWGTPGNNIGTSGHASINTRLCPTPAAALRELILQRNGRAPSPKLLAAADEAVEAAQISRVSQ